MDARGRGGGETFSLERTRRRALAPRLPPRASTSAVTLEQGEQDEQGDCWCGAPARRRRRRGARSDSTAPVARCARALALAPVLGLALLPGASASPVERGKGKGKGKRVTPPALPAPMRAGPPRATPTPTTAPIKRQAARPLFEPTTAWTLNGKTGAGRLAAYPTAAQAPAAIGMQDNLDLALSASRSLSPSSIDFTRASPASAPSTTAPAASASSSSKFVVPAGWVAKSRKTDYYPVPVIIATSVILAVIVIGAIVGSVVWRRKARTNGRRAQRRDPEKALAAKSEANGLVGRALAKVRKRKGKAKAKANGSADGASDHGRASPVAGGSRLRQRRPRRPRPARGDADANADNEGTALTRSVSSGSHAPPDTLTHRLATRLRLNSTAPASEASPTVVFSNSSPLTRSRSTLGSTLSRTSSHQSSLGQPADRPPSLSSLRAPSPAPAPAPASPSLGSPSSTFGGLFALDSSLPAPGPPAYRPSSSTIGTTTRLTSSILPSRRVAPPVDDELRWPEEKARPPSRRSLTPVASTSASPPPPPPPPPPVDERPPEPFAAHLATDDKALLALLAQQSSSLSLSSSSEPVQATAPDAEVDPDGFERFEPDDEREGSRTSTALPPTTTSTRLPLPPAAVRTAFDFNGPQDVLPLPVYVPRPDAPEPSAPPPEDDDDEGQLDDGDEEQYDAEEEQYGSDEERGHGRPASMEGREEHRAV